MAKPTDLTTKTWNKLKAITVPKTGFGEKLDAYQTALKKTETLATRNLKAFDAAADALNAITRHIPEAEKKCNKTLHKDTLAVLEAYRPLIQKEGQELHKKAVQYQGYVDMYKHIRDVCGREMNAIETEMKAASKSLVADLKKTIAKGNGADAKKHVKDAVTELQRLQKASDDSLSKPRVPGPAAETPHADDRPDASVFTALIEKQKDIISLRANIEHELNELLKTAG